MKSLANPTSCDTFVVLPPGTASGCVVFGKNSDRPCDEVQEVVYIPASEHLPQSKIQCTYIEIDQVSKTNAVILSKPSWMWGAEMGANAQGVCIGNEAVWTKLNGPEDNEEKLLGMDLLRLALERSSSALGALQEIVSLLELHGQGGNCSDTLSQFTYHNSFLIADPSEAWVLETAGKLWAAEKITSGVRNISNELSIGTNINMMSSHLKQYAEENSFWDPKNGPFSFKKAFSLDDDDDGGYRYKCGKHLLTKLSLSGDFKETDMFKVLRDKPSGICMSSGSFVSTGSQVSVLQPPSSGKPSCHWFTATPDPHRSVFKPFIFVDDIEFPPQVISPTVDKFCSNMSLDRRHELYKIYENSQTKRKKVDEQLNGRKHDLEVSLVSQVEEILNDFKPAEPNVKQLFKNAVEVEVKLHV